MTAAQRKTGIAQIPVSSSDWKSDANGASVSIHDKPAAFHALSTPVFAFFHEDATSINSAASDNEYLELNA
jgi:hypothetical protein